MKKDNILSYLRSKNFYGTLLLLVCAVFAVSVVYFSVQTNKNKELVDLNEPPVPSASNQQRAEVTVPQISKAETNTNDSLLESDIVSEVEEIAARGEEIQSKPVDKVEKQPQKAQTKNAKNAETEATEDPSLLVMNPSGVLKLKFNEEKGLFWPVTGNVIKDYNMESPVYFETLNQYKCNPSIMISAEVGTDVYSAAEGIVTELLDDEETGLTLKVAIGDDYSLIYGNLKDCTLSVGDKIAEGDIIGQVAEPTKYYVVEGTNLYFEVVKKDENINPLLLLR